MRRWRELALVAITAALVLALSVQLRRAEPMPTPAAMTAFVASSPVTTPCSRISITGTVPSKIVDAPPVYPMIARRAHLSGVVILEADIDEHGLVRHAHVIRSVPLLDQAALDAVAKWQFDPAMVRAVGACITLILPVNFPSE